MKCNHTSDWWKNMIPCLSCGEIYSEEEADRLSARNYYVRHFTPKQEQVIETLKALE